MFSLLWSKNIIADTLRFMECHAICTASRYSIKTLFDGLKQSYRSTLYRDVVHSQIDHNGYIVDAFFFAYGVAIFWGMNQGECLKFAKEKLAPFERQHLDDIESDVFTFAPGETAKIVEDEISLPNNDVLVKLAISHGIAQSVKLETFETSVQKTFHLTKMIPEELAAKGKISLSRREIRKKMGALFIERSSINLRIDILDTPEFFWEYPELEPLYIMTANYLDVRSRIEILNQRLDVIHDLFEVLGTELNHLHSNRLEWTIICLIVIEVLIALLVHVFHII